VKSEVELVVQLKSIGIVIPAYNAEQTIVGIVKDLVVYGFDKKNIIVVDDGSKDRTNTAAAGLGVSVVRHDKNLGKGAALKSGFAVARSMRLKTVCTLDADGQHRIVELGRLLGMVNEFDVVIGARQYQLGRMPFLRWLTNRTTSLVISLISKEYVTDAQCGFRCIAMPVLDRIDLKTNNYQTEAELVARTIRGGFRVGTVPITTIYNNEKSYIRPLLDTIRFIIMALRLLW
jgi:glycosyltransferase involved in cell wall biosynthesis